MNEITVIEELLAQRDFLLNNTWVRWAPRSEGEGCLVGRQEGVDLLMDTRWFSDLTAWAVLRVLPRMNVVEDDPLLACGWWNDVKCRSAGEAIAVLDDAIRLAKEAGNG